jgi:hypothetical protein
MEAKPLLAAVYGWFTAASTAIEIARNREARMLELPAAADDAASAARLATVPDPEALRAL